MEEIIKIENKIYEIRGQKVILDFDLARMYRVETSQLKRAVKRNIERFEGEDFMFELTKEEILRCQIGTSSWGGSRYLPFAFTELGVAMLSSVLRSKEAIEINRAIMRAFVEFRKIATNSLPANNKDLLQLRQDFEDLKKDLDELFTDQADTNEQTRMQLLLISDALAQLQADTKVKQQRESIGYKLNGNNK